MILLLFGVLGLVSFVAFRLGHEFGEKQRLANPLNVFRSPRPRLPTPRAAEPLTMFDHLRIIDTHLLRAQEYVIALGTDRQDLRLNQLFKRVRTSRRVLREVAEMEGAV